MLVVVQWEEEDLFRGGSRQCPKDREKMTLTIFYGRGRAAPLVKEIVFSPLYILASFVKDKVSIGVWIYLWAFYFVPLMYVSVFVPVPYCLDDCSFVV